MNERSFGRKVFETSKTALSFVTIALAAKIGLPAFFAGEYLTAGLSGLSIIGDVTQIKERHKAPNEKSWWNPDWLIWDRLFPPKGANIGSNRLLQFPTSSMVHTTAAA
jgi:hypothetical protein